MQLGVCDVLLSHCIFDRIGRSLALCAGMGVARLGAFPAMACDMAGYVCSDSLLWDALYPL